MTTRQVKTGSKIKVKEYEGAVPEGKKFVRWNTEADGTGISLRPGQIFLVTSDVRLYPMFDDVAETAEAETE